MAKSNVRHDHKSRLFVMVFSEKKELLNLYNAVNGSNYTNPDDLYINTIDDIIYMGMKNDVSFMIDSYLNLYEAQSSWNPNMPLRGVIYFSRLYEGYISEQGYDLYSSTLVKLPTPEYIVFYNGLVNVPDRYILRLSDAFLNQKEDEYALECVATIVNINHGHNEQLMRDCRKLYEYAFFIAKIRENLALHFSLKDAIDSAVKTCIDEEILAGFLKKHRAEVKNVLLEGYADELHIKSEKRLSYNEGMQAGLRKADHINQLYNRLVKDKRFADLEHATTDPEFQRQLFHEYGIE